VKFVLFVEGHTEHKCLAPFLKRWLDPQLPQPVGIQVVCFGGSAKLAKDMAAKAEWYLDESKARDVIAVIGLIDLYASVRFPNGKTTTSERYQWGKQHFESQVGHPRFRMFFAVHEIEAWLLSQPDIFPPKIAGMLATVHNPEAVDFGRPPARLLEELYRTHLNREYKKAIHGPRHFKALDPTVVAAKCPYFASMLDEMLALARSTGRSPKA
jgi:hypothetical protein